MVSKDKGKQKQVTTYYDPDVIEQLRRLSEVTRVPQAVYMREALDDLLKKYAHVLRPAGRSK
jgi:predicted DNA-binding protein